MNILILGDIFGRKGRELVGKFLPELRSQYQPDFIIANTENITSGKGPIPKHLQEMRELGIDAFTWGNHVFAHFAEIASYMDDPESVQIRPANYYEAPGYHIPGKGSIVLHKNGKSLFVVNLMSSIFMRDQVYNPFLRATELLAQEDARSSDAILVDFHRETTAELACMAELLSGKVAFVYGTHTHVQTNDDRILPTGTGMITDVGMTGALNSSIGQAFSGRLPGLITGVPFFSEKPEQSLDAWVLCGVFIRVEDKKCVHVEKIRICE